LEKLEESFVHKNRDFVFLVNQSVTENRTMVGHISQVRKSLAAVLDNEDGAVENQDRIALVTYASNTKRIFSLVEKQKNFTQLRNQVIWLKADVH
jgi:hypothetical protein